MDALTFLKERVALFAGMSEAHLEVLASASGLDQYKKGQTVVFQGMTVDGLHVVAVGKVGVYAKVPNQGVSKVAELGSGEVFGETSIFEMGTAGAAIKAEEDGTYVLTIPQDAFRRILGEEPAFVEKVKALIASRRPPPKAA